MKKPRLTALAVAFALTAGFSGLTVAPAFADDAPAEPAVEQAPAPEPSAETAPPPAPPAPPAPEPKSEPKPDSKPEPKPEPEPDIPPAADPPAEEPSEAEPPADEPLEEESSVEEFALASLDEPTAGSRTANVKTVAAAANDQVTLCHATQGANPWILIQISAQGAYNGHVDVPNNSNDHLTDIIPSFTYTDKGQPKTFPGKNLDFVFPGGVPGWAILANNCNMPAVVTPDASTTPESCDAGSVVGGRIQLTMITGVTYTITGPNGTVGYNASGLSDPVPAGVYSISFTTATTVYTSKASPFDVTVGTFTGGCGTTPVTPAADVTNPSCVAGQLEGGRIQLTLLTGVTYDIEDPNGDPVSFDGTGVTDPLPGGDYKVYFTLDAGYSTQVTNPIPVTVPTYTGQCTADPIETAPEVTIVDETCTRTWDLELGSITLLAKPGITYTSVVGPNGAVTLNGNVAEDLEAGTYEVYYDVDTPDYFTTSPNPLVVEVQPYQGICAPPVLVEPEAYPTPQTCEAFVFLTDGYIQVIPKTGLNYWVEDDNGDPVVLHPNGYTESIPPGTYWVYYSTDPGYATPGVDPLEIVIDPYGAQCDLTTAPTVVPQVKATDMGCLGDGSFRLSNNLGDANAVTWKVNGNTVQQGTHIVNQPGTVTITVSANGPSYGFTQGQRTSWTFTFDRPAGCAGALAFLASTGSSPWATVGLAAVLVGLGGLMLRRRRAEQQLG